MKILANEELSRYGLDAKPDPDQTGLWLFVWIATANRAWIGKIGNLARLLGGEIAKDFARRHETGHVFILRLPLNCLLSPEEVLQLNATHNPAHLLVRLPSDERLAQHWQENGGPRCNQLNCQDFAELLGGRILSGGPASQFVALETPACISETARLAYEDLVAVITGTKAPIAEAALVPPRVENPMAPCNEPIFEEIELNDPPVFAVESAEKQRPNGPIAHIVKLVLIVWGLVWDGVLLEAENLLGREVNWGEANDELPVYQMNEPLVHNACDTTSQAKP